MKAKTIGLICLFIAHLCYPQLRDNSTIIIEGTVLDALTNAGVSGAAVKLYNSNTDNPFNYSCQTDRNGKFSFKNNRIRLGQEVYIDVSHKGYSPKIGKTFIIAQNPEPSHYTVYLESNSRSPEINPDIADSLFSTGNFERAAFMYLHMEGKSAQQESNHDCAQKVLEAERYFREECNAKVAIYLLSEALEICSYESARKVIKNKRVRMLKLEDIGLDARNDAIAGRYQDAINLLKSTVCTAEIHQEEIIRYTKLNGIKIQGNIYFREGQYLYALQEFFKIKDIFIQDRYGVNMMQRCHEWIFKELKDVNKSLDNRMNNSPEAGNLYRHAYAVYDKYKPWLYKDYIDVKTLSVDYDRIIEDYNLSFENTEFTERSWKNVLNSSLMYLAEIYYSGRGPVDTPSCHGRCNVIRGTELFFLAKNNGYNGSNIARDFLSRTDGKLKGMARNELKKGTLPF
jgi:tetratricopeptide (TPR) repeat protein